MIESHSLVTM